MRLVRPTMAKAASVRQSPNTARWQTGCGKSAIIAITALALTGCATTRYQTVYCIQHDQQLPAEPERIKSKLTGQADTDIGVIAGSAIRLRAYGEGLRTILEGCREPNPNK